MTEFDRLFDSVRRPRHRFVLYGDADDTDVVDRFGLMDVDVDWEPLPDGGPGPFVVIETDGEFTAAIAASDLEHLLEPPLHPPEDGSGVSEGYRILFECLDDAIFTGVTRRELLAVSREIEERAFRLGTGTLRVGFQAVSKFDAQADVYRALAEQGDLDVHVYGASDADPPPIPGLTYHPYPDVELERYWILAYDSAGANPETSTLIARETKNGYDSFWTTDPETTRAVLGALAAPTA